MPTAKIRALRRKLKQNRHKAIQNLNENRRLGKKLDKELRDWSHAPSAHQAAMQYMR